MLEHFLETPRKKKKSKNFDFSELQIRPAGRLPRFQRIFKNVNWNLVFPDTPKTKFMGGSHARNPPRILRSIDLRYSQIPINSVFGHFGTFLKFLIFSKIWGCHLPRVPPYKGLASGKPPKAPNWLKKTFSDLKITENIIKLLKIYVRTLFGDTTKNK